MYLLKFSVFFHIIFISHYFHCCAALIHSLHLMTQTTFTICGLVLFSNKGFSGQTLYLLRFQHQINQLWFLFAGYVTTIIEDAKIYATHAKKSSVDADDIKLAIQCRMDQSFTSPPPRDVSLRRPRVTVLWAVNHICIYKELHFICFWLHTLLKPFCFSLWEGERDEHQTLLHSYKRNVSGKKYRVQHSPVNECGSVNGANRGSEKQLKVILKHDCVTLAATVATSDN